MVFVSDGWCACDSGNFVREDRRKGKALTKWNLDYQD